MEVKLTRKVLGKTDKKRWVTTAICASARPTCFTAAKPVMA